MDGKQTGSLHEGKPIGACLHCHDSRGSFALARNRGSNGNLRSEMDVIVKMHTGQGKTLIGLLILKSKLNETGDPVRSRL